MKLKDYISAIILTVILVACVPGNKKEETAKANIKEVTFARYEHIVRIPIDEYAKEAPALRCEFMIEEAESQDKEIEKNINEGIAYAIFGYDGICPKEATDSFIATIKDEYLSLRPEYYNEKAMNSGAEWFNYNYTIKSSVTRGYKDIINYSITTDTYTGGAHGSFTTTLLNFDPATGKEIKLNDFFKDNFEEVLIDRLTRALVKRVGAQSFEELQEMGYLVFNDMFVTDNFELGKDSVRFHYNQYDIAPYALGSSDLTFTYEELKDLIKEQ